jgi:magnesium transporter
MAQRTIDQPAADDGVGAPMLMDAVRPEASAPDAVADRALSVWLFARGEQPRRIEAGSDRLRELVADDDNFVWLDLEGYAAGDLRALADPLDVPERAVAAALAGWERPRFEVFGARSFVSVTVPRLDRAAYKVLAGELDLFVGRNALLSAHKHPVPFAGNVVARAQQDPELLRRDSAFLLSILLDEVLGHYERLTEDLEDEVEETEERALTDGSDAFLGDLLALKRYVFAVYRLADQHRPVFAALLRPDVPFAGGEDVLPYFRDLNERLVWTLGALAAVKDGVNGAFDIYVSQVAHHTNGTMKLLTIVSTVLLPAGVILGLFGTEFDSPRLGTSGGFAAMVASIVLVTALALAYFRRRGWLGPAPSPPSRRRSPEPGDDAASPR